MEVRVGGSRDKAATEVTPELHSKRNEAWEYGAEFSLAGLGTRAGAHVELRFTADDEVFEVEYADGSRMHFRASEVIEDGALPGDWHSTEALRGGARRGVVLSFIRALVGLGKTHVLKKDRARTHRFRPARETFGLPPGSGETSGTRHLVLVHGTYSSSEGCFPALARADEMQELLSAYGENVWTFDHPTLTTTPWVNALELAKELSQFEDGEVDFLSHSRGGLVVDALFHNAGDMTFPFLADDSESEQAVESLAAATSALTIPLGAHVRVGSPAAGTPLADKRVWRVFSLMAQAMSFDTDGEMAQEMAKFLLSAVREGKSLSELKKDLPGLFAMDPRSTFLRWLVRSRFVAQPVTVIAGDLGRGGVIARLAGIAGRLVHRGPHDLIVPTASMYGGIPRTNAPVADVADFLGCMHIRYFQSAEARTRIMLGLGIGLAPAASEAATRSGASRGPSRPSETVNGPPVVIVPDLGGSVLRNAGGELTWPTATLDAAGDVVADGLLDEVYGVLVDTLGRKFRVSSFAYSSAPLAELQAGLLAHLAELNDPYVIAHGYGATIAGGLVDDRLLVLGPSSGQERDRWKKLDALVGTEVSEKLAGELDQTASAAEPMARIYGAGHSTPAHDGQGECLNGDGLVGLPTDQAWKRPTYWVASDHAGLPGALAALGPERLHRCLTRSEPFPFSSRRPDSLPEAAQPFVVDHLGRSELVRAAMHGDSTAVTTRWLDIRPIAAQVAYTTHPVVMFFDADRIDGESAYADFLCGGELGRMLRMGATRESFVLRAHYSTPGFIFIPLTARLKSANPAALAASISTGIAQWRQLADGPPEAFAVRAFDRLFDHMSQQTMLQIVANAARLLATEFNVPIREIEVMEPRLADAAKMSRIKEWPNVDNYWSIHIRPLEKRRGYLGELDAPARVSPVRLSVRSVDETNTKWSFELTNDRFSAITNTTMDLSPDTMARIAPRLNSGIGYDEELRSLLASQVPSQIRDGLGELGRPLRIRVDATSAQFPWELLGNRLVSTEAPVTRELTDLRTESNPDPVGTATAFVLGNIDYEGYQDQLPFAGEEERTVADVLTSAGYDVRKGGDGATPTAALSAARYGILHIAAHGMAATADAKSYVMLGPNDILNASRVDALDGVPRLVFLNCCHSGTMFSRVGRLAADLAAAFMQRGTRAFVATGWPVDDDAAAFFAEAFYAAMVAGHDFQSALLQARVRCRNEFPESLTWAAFQAYGDPHFRLGHYGDYFGDTASLATGTEQSAEQTLVTLAGLLHSTPPTARPQLRERLQRLDREIGDKVYGDDARRLGILWLDLREPDVSNARASLLRADELFNRAHRSASSRLSVLSHLLDTSARLGATDAELERLMKRAEAFELPSVAAHIRLKLKSGFPIAEGEEGQFFHTPAGDALSTVLGWEGCETAWKPSRNRWTPMARTQRVLQAAVDWLAGDERTPEHLSKVVQLHQQTVASSASRLWHYWLVDLLEALRGPVRAEEMTDVVESIDELVSKLHDVAFERG